ncbi:hypothetical protein HGRIS_006621 [Hohenbuehelia grisea]|uniref:Uncharacterized protein n=1 Tax=Hohenbuehelia grisea TaxID=104357 RepID=A0ABR3J9W5_9AGAR
MMHIQKVIGQSSDTAAPAIGSMISAAIPGLGIVIPALIPLVMLMPGKLAQTARDKAEHREMQRLSCAEALYRLDALSRDMDELIENVGMFTNWWKDLNLNLGDSIPEFSGHQTPH